MKVTDDPIKPFFPFTYTAIVLPRENSNIMDFSCCLDLQGYLCMRSDWILQKGWHSQSSPSAELLKQAMCEVVIPIQGVKVH